MIKKIIKKVQGFTPVELVLVVGLGALVAGTLIFMATAPQYMAQQPINVNIKLDDVSQQPVAMAQGETEIVVVGQNNPAIDISAVQKAVVMYDTVRLEGTFNFGTSGGVALIKKVTVLGEPGSKIVGGFVPLTIKSPGVTVRGLTIANAGFIGIQINGDGTGTEPGETITIDKNDITSNASAVLASRTGGWPITISNNELHVTGHISHLPPAYKVNLGIYFVDFGYRKGDSTSNKVTDWTRREDYVDPINIINNNITLNVLDEDVFVADGMLIQGWSVSYPVAPSEGCADARLGWRNEAVLTEADTGGKNPAEWGDNGPVTIIGNKVNLISSVEVFTGLTGINIGRSSAGTNHCLVQGNKIFGSPGGLSLGIVKYPYGYDNRIIDNDLSEFTSPIGISVQAHDTVVKDNTLGPLVEAPVNMNSSISLISVNWHCYSPMPLPVENCILAGNDYSQTGAAGWNTGTGNIVIFSMADMFYPANSTTLWPHGGEEVTRNLISETDFPEGTGTAVKQIRIFRRTAPVMVSGNQIIGLPVDIEVDITGDLQSALNAPMIGDVPPIPSTEELIEQMQEE